MKNFKNYNIVTNKYLEHHDDKVTADEVVLRTEAAKKYWKTHDFDAVNCVYYDDKKETEFQGKREDAMKIHG